MGKLFAHGFRFRVLVPGIAMRTMCWDEFRNDMSEAPPLYSNALNVEDVHLLHILGCSSIQIPEFKET
jgi:hypothetical protein